MDELQKREKQITKTSVIGILANLLLAGGKALVGAISGSIAIILDAANNLTDALSSVITILGIKLAKRKPDHKHPYGYGRIEYFSAIIIAGIILAAGVTFLSESVKKIFQPEIPEYGVASLIVVAVAVVVKLVLGRFVKAQGEKYNSEALVASGSDASFDAIITASTLVGAGITMLFQITLDGWIGAVIALFIIKAGLEMLLESVGSVMGTRPDGEITREIKQAVRETEGVMGAYDLVLHNYGPDRAMGAVHVEVPASMSADEIHRLTRRIQVKLAEQFHIFVTVGIYAVDPARDEDRKTIHALAMEHPGALGTHGVFFNEEMKQITFDVLTDFTVADKDAFCGTLAAQVEERFPGYKAIISLDTNYSD